MELRFEASERYAEIRTPLQDGRELKVVLNLVNNVVEVMTVEPGETLGLATYCRPMFCGCIPGPTFTKPESSTQRRGKR